MDADVRVSHSAHTVAWRALYTFRDSAVENQAGV
jgi:hypothetical protein